MDEARKDARVVSSLSERVQDSKDDMKVILQRALTKGQKTDATRMYLIEEHLEKMAEAVLVLLELREKGL